MGLASEWKKQKPKTLLKDILAGPAADWDEALTKAEKNQTARFNAEAVASADKTLKALETQKKECSAKLHKDTMTWLDQRVKGITAARATLVQQMKQVQKTVEEIRSARDKLATVYDAFLAKPSLHQGEALMGLLENTMKALNGIPKNKLLNDEVLTIQKYVGGAVPTISDYIGNVKKGAPADPKENVKWKRDLAGEIAELTASRKKIFLDGFSVVSSAPV